MQCCWYCEVVARMDLGSHPALRTGHFGSQAKVYCQTHLLHSRPLSRYTRERGWTSFWYNKEWAPPSDKQQKVKNSSCTWCERCTFGNPAEREERYNQCDVGKLHDSAKDDEGGAIEGRDKSQGCDGTEDVQGVPKASDSSPTDAVSVRSMLWEPQRLLNNRKGSLSATYKRSAEANTRAHDLHQKPIQALDIVTCCTQWFQKWEKSSTGHKNQDRLHDELDFTCEGMVTASRSSQIAGLCTMQRALAFYNTSAKLTGA